MKIFKTKNAPAPQTASVANDDGTHDNTPISNDPAVLAAVQLAEFRMTPGAKSLLDRAMDNLAKNTGQGIEDPDQRKAIINRAVLIDAAGNDLGIVVDALVASCEKPTDIGPALYSLAFNVLKAAGFIANLDYRRYLDPRSDFDLGIYRTSGELDTDATSEDPRDDEPSAPYGMDTSIDREIHFYREVYGVGIEEIEDVFPEALRDLRILLQLTIEAYGWTSHIDNTKEGVAGHDNPLPYAMVMNSEGGFDSITDAKVALDHFEVKRKESQTRRRAAEAVRMSNAAERARALVKAALNR